MVGSGPQHVRMDELLRDVGAEENLARRLAELMKESGLSQDALARKMAEVGTPIPQSAISKIIRPPAGGRRAITVDEALGFARVFDVELRDLLLPEEAPLYAELFRQIGAGGRHVHEIRSTSYWLEQTRSKLRALCDEQPDAEPLLRAQLAEMTARMESGEDPTIHTRDEHAFLNDFLATLDEEQA